MIIREANEDDIPEILGVLKASLGEVSSKKTEEVWRFKHIKNPFGKSLVLLAVEDHKIIGVRAFMRWKWEYQDNTFSAFRAVDTATHPDYRGRGIFKKLTLKALDIARQNGDNFVFNTPNDQSKPGYLKMGWKEVDKLRIQLSFSNPLSFFSKKKVQLKVGKIEGIQDYVPTDFRDLLEKRNKELRSQRVITPKSESFLRWRYEMNPLQNYTVFKTSDLFVAFYIKKRKGVKEFRLVEKICLNQQSERLANKWIKLQTKIENAHLISSQPNLKLPNLLSTNLKLGPVLTLKKINLKNENYNSLMNLKNWHYSLGDLELF